MRPTLLIWTALLGCSTGMRPTGLPDGGVDPFARFDVSSWQGAMDEPTLRFVVELKKAHRGESADLDGDGIRELSAFHTVDGATHWVWQPEYFPSFEVVRAADGTVTRTIDYENYNYPSEVDVFSADAGGALFQLDDNNDGVFDRRITRTTDPVDGGYLWVEEDTDGGPRGVFMERARWVSDRWADQMGSGSDHCNGTSNMPTEIGLFAENVPGITAIDTGAAGCSLMQKAKLGKAVDCMKKKLECLSRTNPAMRNRLVSRLATDEWQFGCNNPCPGRDATTNARVGDLAAQTNFSSNVLNASDDYLCSIVIHEALHMAESPYNPADHDANGNDEIYSCARYCAGCVSGGPNSAGRTPNMDCAVCAGTSDSKRRACGVKRQVQPVGPGYSVCTGGLGTLMTACPDWHAPVEQDCNGKQIGQPNISAGCCNMCPANAATNSKPCGAPPPPTDTCSMKAPECP
jgi:hypothetical protein